jgi:hypothetical protein
MKPRTLKIIAVTYAVKTLLVGIAWVTIPDLPTRASAKAREVWAAIFQATTP